MTKKDLTLTINNLNLIIDINRVGTDEIEVINETIEHLELQNITIAWKNLKELLSWSDRLGSDEIDILEKCIELLEK